MQLKKLLNYIGKEPLCNHKPERAPHFGKFVFILCWRCTGVLLGALLTVIPQYFGWLQSTIHNWKILFPCFFMAIPMVVDSFLQLKTSYVSDNTKRFITGLLFGFFVKLAIFVIIGY